MTKKLLKQKKVIDNYAFYLFSCDKMRNSINLNLKRLQRVLRPSCKTTLFNDTILVFRIKGTKKHCRISLVSKKNSLMNSYYFEVSTSFQNFQSLQISCITLKELMKKINYNYSLLKPFENVA